MLDGYSVAASTGEPRYIVITVDNQDAVYKAEAFEIGQQGPPGATGATGAPGPYFVPAVSTEGILSWTNTGNLPNPDAANLTAIVTAVVSATRQQKRLTFTGVTVAASAWGQTPKAEAAQIAGGYVVCATVKLAGATASMYPDVVLGVADRDSGNFSGVAQSTAGGLVIYAKEAPKAGMTIPTIVLWP